MTSDSVISKLWSQAGILRNDGVGYNEYLSELTFLVFLKMVEEQDLNNQIPVGYRWSDLSTLDGRKLLTFYEQLLIDLGKDKIEISEESYRKLLNNNDIDIIEEEENGVSTYYIINKNELLKKIFHRAKTAISEPKNLKTIINAIDAIDWFSQDRENLGDMYEGLLEKNAEDTKSGAGQYFTPRAVIDAIVEVIKPRLGEKLLDPASGTFGFMVAANKYLREHNDYHKLNDVDFEFQKSHAFSGMELVPATYRLALMNALLHDIDPKDLRMGNSLSENGMWMKNFDVVLTNPPFGIANERATRSDVTFESSNKQLNFLQVIYNSLKKDGIARAAVVIPDGVLSGTGIGAEIRRDLLHKTNLHTVLRLPTGIFYKPGVKTYVLFFTRGETDDNNTKEVWYYDLRALNHFTPKQNKLKYRDFKEFIELYAGDENGVRHETYSEENPNGRWRKYTIEEILEDEGVSLDLHWIREEEEIRDITEIIEEYETERSEIDLQINKLLEEIHEILGARKK
ncbi:class I SAM-dependent DNA methyltransferase [Bacillus cabrialesii]|uniref:class I SAM-dependent DNA methyltransferase n=1 Tax=Bacillus cabrialesii TaxID=2487276 RepID=UPI0028F89A08|nr:N-6 DNA methylase [Bacillus cabrialesii]MDU0156109.1 N-6 DNA methylase [Bacillus cabrialesii]